MTPQEQLEAQRQQNWQGQVAPDNEPQPAQQNVTAFRQQQVPQFKIPKWFWVTCAILAGTALLAFLIAEWLEEDAGINGADDTIRNSQNSGDNRVNRSSAATGYGRRSQSYRGSGRDSDYTSRNAGNVRDRHYNGQDDYDDGDDDRRTPQTNRPRRSNAGSRPDTRSQPPVGGDDKSSDTGRTNDDAGADDGGQQQ